MPQLLAVLAGAALALAPAVPAAATGTTDLRLTVTRTDTASAARGVTLRCDPPGGSHPEAAAACDRLARTGGFPGDDGTGRKIFCTMEYDPVEARAEGTWRGRPVDFRRTYSNRCQMISGTGPVFAF